MSTPPSTGSTPEPGDELPVPADFPVTWDDEEHKKLFWRWDDTHSPLPASPMTTSLSEPVITEAIGRVEKELRRAGHGVARRINGYNYFASLPGIPTPSEKDAQRAAMESASAVARRRWDEDYLPILVRDLEHMRSLDLRSATDRELARHLEEFIEIERSHWYIHFMAVFPTSGAAERMASLYREIMGDVPDEDPYLLLQGIDNKSLETDRALQALAEHARDRPEARAAFAEETDVGLIMRRLGGVDQGRGFIAKLEEFLGVYGYRPTGFDFVFPSWIEDPAFVILMVKSYLASPPRDLTAQAAAQRAESQRLLDAVQKAVGDDEVRWSDFFEAHVRARGLWSLREDHAFYIDQGSLATLRILMAEMGSRLARRGVLAHRDDVFYLFREELEQAMGAADGRSLMPAVDSRRAERERFSRITPPRFLGTVPAEGIPDGESEFSRMSAPVDLAERRENATVLRGLPASRGKAVGPARVVRSPDEFHKVRPGDVLVCTATSPTWTPVFGTVSALVTDSGGVLSHASIVAREYGLPAVVGVNHGTSTIRDGQVVTVDGTGGLVLLH